jgi:hypothetical protein
MTTMNKKEPSSWLTAWRPYLTAIEIGLLIGTSAYSAVVAFLVMHGALGLLRKIGINILQVLT